MVQVKKNASLWMIAIVFSLLPLALFAKEGESMPDRVGFIDMQDAIFRVEEGKKAKTQLEKEFKEKKGKLEKEESEIKGMAEEFHKKSMVLSEDGKKAKQVELETRFQQFQSHVTQAQATFKQREDEVLSPILKKMEKVIRGLAQAQGYILILEKNKSGILFAQDQDDLTDRLIVEYNKRYESSDKGKDK